MYDLTPSHTDALSLIPCLFFQSLRVIMSDGLPTLPEDCLHVYDPISVLLLCFLLNPLILSCRDFNILPRIYEMVVMMLILQVHRRYWSL